MCSHTKKHIMKLFFAHLKMLILSGIHACQHQNRPYDKKFFRQGICLSKKDPPKKGKVLLIHMVYEVVYFFRIIF